MRRGSVGVWGLLRRVTMDENGGGICAVGVMYKMSRGIVVVG